jgi:hypothetical protein
MTTLAFDPSARRLDDGRVLLGGHPVRKLRLTAAGARLVDGWRAGEPVGDGAGAQRLARRLIDAGLAHPRPAAGGVSFADVAVVIPAFDRAGALAECLARVGACRELVVVDDGSTDPAAIAAATAAPFVAFLDSDTLPRDGWLEPLLAHFADPRVAAVAPRVRVPAGTSALSAYEAARSPLDLGPHPGVVGPGRRIGYVPAAALVVRRSALVWAPPPRERALSRAQPEELHARHAFDEGMRFGEDVDLVWRLVATGWTVRYEPAAVVEHPHRATLRAWLTQRAAYGSSAGPLAQRHPGQMRHVVVPRSAILPWALVLAGRPKLALAATTLHPPRRRELAALALESRARTARQIADAATRAHAPVLLASRRGRRLLAAAFVAGTAADWLTRRPALDPVRFGALRAADDLAYVTGVWAGCLRTRTAAPLLPAILARSGKYPKLDRE